MGVFEQFPYANMHEMNLDWLIKMMKELDKAMETFKATESLKFADPIIWDITTQYEKSTIVLDPTGNAYLSLKAVPAGVQLNNDEYWLEIFNFTDYTRTANQNLTVNTETNTTRATDTYQVDDWLIWNDVLYRVTSPIAIDDAFIVAPAAGSNIIHFTVEDFIKAFITYATGLINQYKNDIDASEIAYRQQLAQDVATTTASLQAQLDQAISGATVDSEVILARVGFDNTTYSTLGEAIRVQIGGLFYGLEPYHAFDILALPRKTDRTSANVSFTWVDNVCTVNGTSNANAIYTLVSQTSNLWHFEKNKTYQVRYSATNVRLEILFYVNGNIDSSLTKTFLSNGEFTVPNNVEGIIVRLRVLNGVTVNENVSPAILTDIPIEEVAVCDRGVYTGNDANAINENSWYFCDGTTVANCPNSTQAFIILTLALTSLIRMQIAYNWSNGDLYWRRYTSGSWDSWRIKTDSRVLKNLSIYTGNDANDISTSSWYFCDGTTVANCPDSTLGYYILTLPISSASIMQVAYDWTRGNIYWRRYRNSTWSSWIMKSRFTDFDNTFKYYAFGDSLTWGSVWESDGQGGHTIRRTDWKNQIPTRIAKALNIDDFDNQGTGGMAYVPDVAHGTLTESILDRIRSIDLTNVSLITIAGGRNDAYNALGTRSSIAGDGTVCGAIKEIINYMRSTYPKVQFIFIGCTPSASSNSNIWSVTYPGGWSLQNFDDEVGAICETYHVPYVDWKLCQYVNSWATYTGAGGNYSHPNNDEGYLQMGSYAAGQVGKYYHGN